MLRSEGKKWLKTVCRVPGGIDKWLMELRYDYSGKMLPSIPRPIVRRAISSISPDLMFRRRLRIDPLGLRSYHLGIVHEMGIPGDIEDGDAREFTDLESCVYSRALPPQGDIHQDQIGCCRPCLFDRLTGCCSDG